MKYLLDTNICIGFLSGRALGVLKRLQTTPAHDIVVCSVVKAELFYGAERSQNPAQTRHKQELFLSQFHSLPFDDAAAAQAGYIRAQLAHQGTPIGPHDCLIAAMALTHNLILVTHNLTEFSRVTNLKVESWL